MVEIRATYEYLEKHADVSLPAIRPSHCCSRLDHDSVELQSSCAAVTLTAAESAVKLKLFYVITTTAIHTRCRIS